MAVVVSSGQRQSDFSYHLIAICRGAFAALVLKPQSPGLHEMARNQAIEALSGSEAGPDTREWAERYLCGMAGADVDRFLAARKRQE